MLDTTRRRLLVFGGTDMLESSPPLDVHALSIDGPPTWSRVSTAPGPPLTRAPLLWDDDHRGLLVLDRQVTSGGGMGAWHVTIDDSVRWEPRPVVGAPSPRPIDGAAVRDTRHGGAWYVGLPSLAPAAAESVWYVQLGDTVRFVPLSVVGESPGGRIFPALAYDPARDRLLIHGGAGDSWVTPMEKAGLAWEATLGDAPEWRADEPRGDRPPTGLAQFVEIPDEPQARLEYVDGRVFRVSWELPPPPVAVAESASVVGRTARLVWSGGGTDGWAADVERRTANGAWQAIGLVTSDRGGCWRYTDANVPPGEVAYRLVYERATGPIVTGEVRVGTVAPAGAFRIASVRPNPARQPERIELVMPRAGA